MGPSIAIKKYKYVASICSGSLKYFYYMGQYSQAKQCSNSALGSRQKQMALLEMVVGFVKAFICINKLRLLDVHYYISKASLRLVMLCCCWLVCIKMVLYQKYRIVAKNGIDMPNKCKTN